MLCGDGHSDVSSQGYVARTHVVKEARHWADEWLATLVSQL
jgi:hypothetical protein